MPLLRILHGNAQDAPLLKKVAHMSCSRSMDGLTLLMSSSDGFCSALTFTAGELGQIYSGPIAPHHHSAQQHSTSSSAVSTPVPTPASTHTLPVSRQPSSSILASLSPLAAIRPSSPTRSNSASSIATQSSMAPAHTPSTMNIPGPNVSVLSSSNSGQLGPVSNLPLTTPPQTPMSVTGNTSGSTTHANNGSLGKRDSTFTSESEQEVDEGQGTTAKRRKIAPTSVSSEEEPHGESYG